MTEAEKLAYTAGIIDGEGHFYYPDTTNGKGRHYHYSRVVVVNTNKEVIDWFKSVYGGNITLYSRHKKNSRWNDYWRWQLQGKKAEELAQALLPYIIIKKQQIKRITTP